MIAELISDLPEVYQPIYGHPDLSVQASRICDDRLQHIEKIYSALQALLGRNLRVLDLGCAQGYFSLSLAKLGALVHGVDFLDKNIAVCNELSTEMPDLQVTFEVACAEEVISKIQLGQYDLVLGLSVFHHIIHERGADEVKSMLTHAAAHCGVLVVEFALREEPLYWAHAQPENPYMLLEEIAFVHEVARHSTHLGPISRPLLLASNRYWIFEGGADQFNDWSFKSHFFAAEIYQDTRRYYFGSKSILKYYSYSGVVGEHNKVEFWRSVDFLKNPPVGFDAPSLIDFGENEAGAWLVMEKIPGRLLLDVLRGGGSIDENHVLLSVLAQLVTLERAGLYHDDVRTWNVLVAEDGRTTLIDYGSISTIAKDCVWPGNIFLAFIIFVHEVTTGAVDDPDPLREIAISPYRLKQPYCAWANVLWKLPLERWSFELMYQTLKNTPVNQWEGYSEQPLETWMKAIEEAIEVQKLRQNNLHIKVKVSLNKTEADLEAIDQKIKQGEIEAEKNKIQILHAFDMMKTSQERIFEFIRNLEVAQADNLAIQKKVIQTLSDAQAEQRQRQLALDRANYSEAQEKKYQKQFVEISQTLESIRQELHNAHQLNHSHRLQLERTAQQLHDAHQLNNHLMILVAERDTQIQVLLNSRSWRYAAPIRRVVGLFRQIKNWSKFRSVFRAINRRSDYIVGIFNSSINFSKSVFAKFIFFERNKANQRSANDGEFENKSFSSEHIASWLARKPQPLKVEDILSLSRYFKGLSHESIRK